MTYKQYKHDFMQEMISSDLGPRELQSCFNIKDALFSVTMAWNNQSRVSVCYKTETLAKAWSNLMANIMGDLMNDFDISVHEQIDKWNSAGRQFFKAQSSQQQSLEPIDVHEWIIEKKRMKMLLPNFRTWRTFSASRIPIVTTQVEAAQISMVIV